MYYLIDNDPNMRYDNAEDVVEAYVTTDYYENNVDGFEEFLDEGNGVEVCGYDFSPSEILRELNYDAYQNELRYWAENEVENNKGDYQYELERASHGEQVWVCSHTVYCYDDDDDDEEESGDTDGDEQLFAMLEERIRKQKENEAQINEEEEKTGNEFLSALGIQII